MHSQFVQAAGDSSPLPPLRVRLSDDDEWEEMLEEHEEWLDENGHKLVERVVGAQKKSRGQCRGDSIEESSPGKSHQKARFCVLISSRHLVVILGLNGPGTDAGRQALP